jgi:enamine deaminase RidA (YjgF/YER057c/UK114 family)
MNEAWEASLDRENAPVRATIEARLASPAYLVEMMAVAAL